MLMHIVAHEWRVLRADRTLWFLLAIIVALVAYGYANGASWARDQRQSVAQALADDSTRLATLHSQLVDIEQGRVDAPSPFQSPALPAPVGRSLGTRAAVLPPAALAATSVGQGDLFPSYVIVSTVAGDAFFKTPSIENPLHLLAGRFDLAFVIVFLLPLLVLGIGYAMLSQEREDGTLALLLTQPVGGGTLVAGKLLARFMVIMVALAIAAAVALAVDGTLVGATGAMPAVWLWLGVVSAYALFWLLLAALVNLRGRSSAENAMTLATAWLALTLLVPAALNITATLRFPMPSRAEMIGVEREAAEEAQQQGATLLAAFYQDHPELAPAAATEGPVNFAAQSWAVQEEVERVVAPVRARYDEQSDKQRALLRRFRFLSPALVTQEALQDVAGTGDVRYSAFRAQVNTLRAEFREFIGARILRRDAFTSEDVARIPSFDLATAPAVDGDATGRVLVNLFALLVGGCALAALVAWQLPTLRERARG